MAANSPRGRHPPSPGSRAAYAARTATATSRPTAAKASRARRSRPFSSSGVSSDAICSSRSCSLQVYVTPIIEHWIPRLLTPQHDVDEVPA